MSYSVIYTELSIKKDCDLLISFVMLKVKRSFFCFIKSISCIVLFYIHFKINIV